MNVSHRLALLSAVVLMGVPAEAQVYNLHLVTDNQPDYTDMKSFVESSTGAWKNPDEKAVAVWRWGRRSRRQLSCSREGTRYIADPILNYNSYGALNCGIISALNIGSWLELGYQARYVQLGDHTVSEVSWDGGRSWHMFDSSMSAFCYNHAGQVASCEEIKEAHGCELSGGKEEPGHYYLYHPAPRCASHLGPTGWRSASDNPVEFNRTLLAGASSYTDGFSIDRYCQNARYGHRYVLNIRPHECYTRYWSPFDGRLDPKKKNPDFFRPLPNRLDPDGGQGVCNVRSNGSWSFQPDLSDPECQKLLFDSGGQTETKSPESQASPPVVFSKTSPKLHLGDGVRTGYAAFQVSAANVITSMRLEADILCGQSPGTVRILVSHNAGIGWQEVWRSEKAGRHEVRLKLREQVAGTPFCLIKIEMTRAEEPVGLDTFRVFATTLVNHRTLPALTLGSNEIVLRADEQAETLELWPFLHAGLYKQTVFAEDNVFSDELPDGTYKATLGSAVNNKECSATWRLASPTDILDVSYVVVSTVRTDRHWVSLEHSWDGKHFERFYRHTKSDFPMDRRTERKFAGKEVPAGARQAFFRAVFFSPSGAASYNMAGIQDLLIRIHRKPRSEAFKPFCVTYNWIEHRDGGDQPRTHSELVSSLPHRYRINVLGKRDPTMFWVQLSDPRSTALSVPGYSDGLDEGPGCEYAKVSYRWGKNVAQGKPYTSSRPSSDLSKNPDSDSRELTNGVVIAPTEYVTSKAVQPATAFWDAGEPVRFVIDLGNPQTVAGVRACTHQPDARYCHPETVEVAVSADAKTWEPAGVILHDDLWKPPGDYEPWEHDDHPRFAKLPGGGRLAYGYPLVSPKPLAARFVRFTCTPLQGKGMGLSEFQVFDKAEVAPWPKEILLPPVQGDASAEQREAEERLFDRYVFSPGGKYLLSLSSWGMAVLWNADDGSFVRIVRRNGECRADWAELPSFAAMLQFSPDGNSLLVSRGTLSDCRLSLEDTATGKRLVAFPLRPNTVLPSLCFSDDGRYLIGSGSYVIGVGAGWTKPPLDVWDTRTGRRVWDHDQPPPYSEKELEDARRALPPEVGKSIWLTEDEVVADLKLLLFLRKFRDDGKLLVARDGLSGPATAFFTPDGRYLITRDSIMLGSEYSSEAVFWDIAHTKFLHEMEELDEWIEPYIFTSDGKLFLHKQGAAFFETATGRPIKARDRFPISTVWAMTGDGQLALGEGRQLFVLFDLREGTIRMSQPTRDLGKYQATFSPNGDRFAVSCLDRCEVHETKLPCRKLCRLDRKEGPRHQAVAAVFSPDGRRIVYGDALWNADTGEKHRQFHVRKE